MRAGVEPTAVEISIGVIAAVTGVAGGGGAAFGITQTEADPAVTVE